MDLNVYLYFNGECEAAFKFYEKALGGKIEMMLPHEGTPAACSVPDDWKKKILHARMSIGHNVLMASDSPPEHAQTQQGFSININVDDPDKAERVFNALAEGGLINMPLSETFFAKKFGMLKDQFGTHWMVNCQSKGVGSGA